MVAGTIINTSADRIGPKNQQFILLQLRLRLSTFSSVNGTDERPRSSAASDPAATTPRAHAPTAQAAAPATLDTATLFAGGSEVRLIHRGQEYRLRVTRQGKLILTK